MRFLIALTGTILLASCGGGGDSSSTPAPAPAPVQTPATQPLNVAGVGLASGVLGRAYITFTAPYSNGNSPITAYTADCTAGGSSRVTASAPGSPIVVEGLMNGFQYACSVTARNSVGQGSVSTAVSVSIPTANPNSLRFVYAIPTDRAFNQSWLDALTAEMADLQQWYKSQLDGKTFTVYRTIPELCKLPRDGAYYHNGNTWDLVRADLVSSCNLNLAASDLDWVIYADVTHDARLAGRLGAGGPGLTMMPRQDLEGLGGAACIVSDDGKTYCHPQTRWVGGAGHEIAHSLGVPHPPGCDAGDTVQCNSAAQQSIMWLGYANYPGTYFLQDAKTILLGSKFIK